MVQALPVRARENTAGRILHAHLRYGRLRISARQAGADRGGRQSAFEWAALIRENGADQIYVTHRHATPQFTEPDWSWVQPMVRRTLEDRGWWRRLTDEEKDKIRKDFWAVGRLTLEATQHSYS